MLHMNVNEPDPNLNYVGSAQFWGWAVDDQAAIASVDISIDGVDKGNATYGIYRPDVCASTPGGLNYATSYDYDALDDLISVTQGIQSRTFTYDAVRRLVAATNPESGTVTYRYDALGRVAAEYGPPSTAPCTTCYLSHDHLGSVRLVTDQNGSVVARHDYLPFGEEFVRGGQFGANDGVNQKFTRKERDQETLRGKIHVERAGEIYKPGFSTSQAIICSRQPTLSLLANCIRPECICSPSTAIGKTSCKTGCCSATACSKRRSARPF